MQSLTERQSCCARGPCFAPKRDAIHSAINIRFLKPSSRRVLKSQAALPRTEPRGRPDRVSVAACPEGGAPRPHITPLSAAPAAATDFDGIDSCSCSPLLPRRTVLLRSFALPAVLGSLTIGSDDPITLLNSVLSGYGLPKLPGSAEFKLLDDFEQDFLLEYPRSWVVRPNTLRQGVYISDFNTADKLSVEVLPLTRVTRGSSDPSDLLIPGSADLLIPGSADLLIPGSADLITAAVTAAVVPGAGAGQQDDKLLLPPASSVKSRIEVVDGREYTYMEFRSETITRSGYQIRRRNFAVAAVKRGNLYTLNASARSDQYDKDKEALLRHIVDSFRVR